MEIWRRSSGVWALLLIAVAALSVRADERAPGARAAPARTYDPRPVRISAAERAGTQVAMGPHVRSAPVRNSPVNFNGRYPFGQFHGGYRYPFNYPYYHYTPRQYPFGNGPYGPYGSNPGGYYTGNRYDPGVYGRPLPPAPAPPAAGQPVAPPAPPPADEPDAPPARKARPPAAAPDADEGAPPEVTGPSLHARPVPNPAQAWGDPVPYYGGNPFNNTYGAAQAFAGFPFGYYVDDMWFGRDRLIYGMGWYPNRNYNYFYGPPSGFGFYGPEYMPQYYNYSTRNFGPYYPGLGGINGGEAFYQGGS